MGWAPQYSGLAFNVIELFGVNCATTYGPEPTACVFATYFASLSNTSPARPVSAHSTAHYTVEAGDGTDKYVLGMNNAAGKPTGDKRVREAIRYAIDHDQLIAARGGAGEVVAFVVVDERKVVVLVGVHVLQPCGELDHVHLEEA